MTRKTQLQLAIALLAAKIVVPFTVGLPNIFQSVYYYHLCALISLATYVYLLIFLYQVVHTQEKQALSIVPIRLIIGVCIFEFSKSFISSVFRLETFHTTMLQQALWSLPSFITLVSYVILSIQLLKNNSPEYEQPIRFIGISFLIRGIGFSVFFPLLIAQTDFSIYLYKYYIPEILTILPFAAMIYFYKSILSTLEFSLPDSSDQHPV